MFHLLRLLHRFCFLAVNAIVPWEFHPRIILLRARVQKFSLLLVFGQGPELCSLMILGQKSRLRLKREPLKLDSVSGLRDVDATMRGYLSFKYPQPELPT